MLGHFERHPMVPAGELVHLRQYLESPRDWCLSRQLWWGHQVPAYRLIVTAPGVKPVANGDENTMCDENTVNHTTITNSINNTVIPSPINNPNPINNHNNPNPINNPNNPNPINNPINNPNNPITNPLTLHCTSSDGTWIVAASASQARAYATSRLHCPPGTFRLQRDPDVLDTWFSSGLLPRLAAPREPLALMETGADILFFWVTRMAWLAAADRRNAPFVDVLLHPMVLDPAGKKMSKSKGNVIDPLAVIRGESLQQLETAITSRKELSKREVETSLAGMRKLFPAGIRAYGNDVLRLALVSEAGRTAGIKMGPVKLEHGRYVANKLWNLFRFFHNYAQDESREIVPKEGVSPVDRYMTNKGESVAREESRFFEEFEISRACETAVNHLLHDICDLWDNRGDVR